MKIAILTLPFHANYGGILQAYALQTVLQRRGHEVVVLDQDQYYHRPWWRQQLAFAAYLFRKYLLRQETVYVNLWKSDREKRITEKPLRRFIDAHMNIVQVKHLPADFPRDVDAVIVGSDQVWRPKYFSGAYGCGVENAFLPFLEGLPLKRIAYAASFGTGEWEYSEEETAHCARLLQLFDAVSVREESALALCREKLQRADAVRMPDPTLLLTKEDYLALIPAPEGGKRYLLYYVLDETEETRRQAANIAEERGLEIKRISGDTNRPDLPLSQRIKTPIEEWLGGIAHSEYVFTDSFHGSVFSIIFDKPFQCIGNTGRGMDRFRTLLADFGSADRQGRLAELRKAAMDFLAKIKL